jgi:hypothetical protein
MRRWIERVGLDAKESRQARGGPGHADSVRACRIQARARTWGTRLVAKLRRFPVAASPLKAGDFGALPFTIQAVLCVLIGTSGGNVHVAL